MPARLPGPPFHSRRLTPLNRTPVPFHRTFLYRRNLSTAIGQIAMDPGHDESAHQTVTLLDGRTLGFSTYGARTGPAIFYFHGLPSSRLEAVKWDEYAQKLGARIVGVDRPGIGLSTFYRNRKLSDWPLDVTQLAQHLGIDRFRVVGGSGGAPYALACAHYLPREQLRAVGILAGMGPWDWQTMSHMPLANRIFWNSMACSPALTRLGMDWYLGKLARDPDPTVLYEGFRKQLKLLPKKDQALFDDENFFLGMVESLRESFRQGPEGNADDVRLMTSSWGFTLEEVEFLGVRLWYGTKDLNAPVGLGRSMVGRLPHGKLRTYEGASHFSIGVHHLEDVLKDILEDE